MQRGFQVHIHHLGHYKQHQRKQYGQLHRPALMRKMQNQGDAGQQQGREQVPGLPLFPVGYVVIRVFSFLYAPVRFNDDGYHNSAQDDQGAEYCIAGAFRLEQSDHRKHGNGEQGVAERGDVMRDFWIHKPNFGER